MNIKNFKSETLFKVCSLLSDINDCVKSLGLGKNLDIRSLCLELCLVCPKMYGIKQRGLT